MRMDELRVALPADLAGQLKDWEAVYRRERPSDVADGHGFARWLVDTGRVPGAVVGELDEDVTEQPTEGASTLAGTQFLDTIPDRDVTTEDELALLPDGEPLTVKGRLAAGAMGEVLIVEERDLQRTVALKRMHPSIATHPHLARRFLAEAQITAQLDHPNIVPVYNLLIGEGRLPAYTMKLVRGKTFAELIREARALWTLGEKPIDELSTPSFLDHFVRACDALAYAHSRGVVHRDLKPDNIMVGPYGEVYVMDWGIARVNGSSLEEDSIQLSASGEGTRHGAVLGTPAYMSPEQAQGDNLSLDGRSDVFSLGLILAELITLQSVVKGKDTQEILAKIATAELSPLVHIDARGTVMPSLQAIVSKATALLPSERYATADDLGDDVRRWLRGAPVFAYAEPWQKRVSRWMIAHQRLVGTAVAGFVFIAVIIAISSLFSTLYTVRQSSFREARLAELQSSVSGRGRVLDARFQALPGHLDSISNAVVEVLSDRSGEVEGPEGDWYLDVRMAPDLAPSSAYGQPISLAHPSMALPANLPITRARPSLRRLATLDRVLKRVLVRAHPVSSVSMPRSARAELLRAEPGQIRWIHVALDSGVGFSYPGNQGLPPGLDLRREVWYETATSPHVHWGEPRRSTHAPYGLIPVSLPIYDESGWRLGAVAIEIDLAAVVGDRLMPAAVLPGMKSFILDENGDIVLSSETEDDVAPARQRWMRRRAFEDPGLQRAIRTLEDGHEERMMEDGSTDLVVWSRMGSVGWTYVVEAPSVSWMGAVP